MNNTLTLLKRGFESSIETTPKFKRFTRTFKSEFNKLLKKIGCTDLECHNGHFYIYGFFNAANGQLWYFSLSDVRDIFHGGSLLIRTAEHRKDYYGGTNRYADMSSLEEELSRILRN
ncbi:hypothetical protein [uncultured Bacteroides sp.]|uniref:hypothetical protein n=1 Tax=uncultured Bacteroides sp. TaxID=162156 RepID=UPI0025DD7C74|nr:hypothetical protein [uncultured Bacteroides sp.]